jgi:predicted dehydrogenase
MKSLIIGMGIGSLYQTVLHETGNETVTVDVDPAKKSDYTSLESALNQHAHFDTVHICTPNYTHAEIADLVAGHTRIVFVEKPGVATEYEWKRLVERHPNTRITMVKNNQWRPHYRYLKESYQNSESVTLRWENQNRVPSAGSWFTTRRLAFGGVSRDLLPHLLSFVSSWSDQFDTAEILSHCTEQRWQLGDLKSTEYGTVQPNGTYDVDDFVKLELTLDGKKLLLIADWKNNSHDDRSVCFSQRNSAVRFELGLCPESAYQMMIETAFQNLNNDAFWEKQYRQDTWIHRVLESMQ